MALIIDLAETAIGVPFADAYARITMLRADKEGVTMQVSHYASSGARAANAQPVLDISIFAPTAELRPGPTPLAIGYNWLKTQRQYAAARDA